jgi:hypothetical protein
MGRLCMAKYQRMEVKRFRSGRWQTRAVGDGQVEDFFNFAVGAPFRIFDHRSMNLAKRQG